GLCEPAHRDAEPDQDRNDEWRDRQHERDRPPRDQQSEPEYAEHQLRDVVEQRAVRLAGSERPHQPAKRCCAVACRSRGHLPTEPSVTGRTEAPSSLSAGSHPSQRGRYQFQSPSRFIVAGSRTPRTSVASIRTAVASPTPNCFIMISDSVPKIENTNTITTAALVTTPAVGLIPWATASSVFIPLS